VPRRPARALHPAPHPSLRTPRRPMSGTMDAFNFRIAKTEDPSPSAPLSSATIRAGPSRESSSPCISAGESSFELIQASLHVYDVLSFVFFISTLISPSDNGLCIFIFDRIPLSPRFNPRSKGPFSWHYRMHTCIPLVSCAGDLCTSDAPIRAIRIFAGRLL